jgi:allophanate hydrolase
VVVGKTNMDQFATGLTGSRSPYGAVASVLDPARIAGGSSSGSAVAVALGLADVGLGTDTAGSGRVPAACNGIVGLKPSVGLVPIDGIVPACRSIDCPSVFTRTLALARSVLSVLAPGSGPAPSFEVVRVGVPALPFLDPMEPAARLAYLETVDDLAKLDGVAVVEVDLGPFFAVGDLLYGGAWVAERYAAVGAFLEAHAGQPGIDPVVESIILGARTVTAASAFADHYRLDGLRAGCAAAMAGVDALVLPTVPGVPTLAEVAASPIETNTALGRYTTFVNLLGMCAVAVAGVSVVARGGDDWLALDLAALVEGGTVEPSLRAEGWIPLAVVGAHLEGQPLNRELTDRGGRLARRTTTSPDYRLHALATTPPKPGLVRGGDAAIEVEVWWLPAEGFATFVAGVPAPLAIGKVELAGGEWVPGFVCEPGAVEAAPDISSFGGWRSYLRGAS